MSRLQRGCVEVGSRLKVKGVEAGPQQDGGSSGRAGGRGGGRGGGGGRGRGRVRGEGQRERRVGRLRIASLRLASPRLVTALTHCTSAAEEEEPTPLEFCSHSDKVRWLHFQTSLRGSEKDSLCVYVHIDSNKF